MYSMTPNIFKLFFFAYEYPKYTEFHADFKSAEIIEKSAPTQKKLFAKILQVGSCSARDWVG